MQARICTLHVVVLLPRHASFLSIHRWGLSAYTYSATAYDYVIITHYRAFVRYIHRIPIMLHWYVEVITWPLSEQGRAVDPLWDLRPKRSHRTSTWPFQLNSTADLPNTAKLKNEPNHGLLKKRWMSGWRSVATNQLSGCISNGTPFLNIAH